MNFWSFLHEHIPFAGFVLVMFLLIIDTAMVNVANAMIKLKAIKIAEKWKGPE